MKSEDDLKNTEADENAEFLESIGAAFDEVQEREETAEPAQVEKTPSIPEKARDEAGKFAKGEATPAKAETPVTEPAKVADTAIVIKAPAGWTAEAKNDFAKLPPHIQAEINRRELDMEKGLSKVDAERAYGRELRDVITPYMPMIQAEGGTAAKAIQDLLNTAYQLRTAAPERKAQLFHQMAKRFGVSLENISQPQPNANPEVQTLQQRLDQIERDRQTEKQQLQNQQDAVLRSEIETFAAKPEHAHYEKVRSHMIALLGNNVAKDLQDAYDQACWANPEVRSLLEAQRTREAEEKRKTENAGKTAAARRAGASVRGGPGASVPANQRANNSIEDDVSAAYDDAVASRV